MQACIPSRLMCLAGLHFKTTCILQCRTYTVGTLNNLTQQLFSRFVLYFPHENEVEDDEEAVFKSQTLLFRNCIFFPLAFLLLCHFWLTVLSSFLASFSNSPLLCAFSDSAAESFLSNFNKLTRSFCCVSSICVLLPCVYFTSSFIAACEGCETPYHQSHIRVFADVKKTERETMKGLPNINQQLAQL